jgi:CRISPR-associated protein Cmr1
MRFRRRSDACSTSRKLAASDEGRRRDYIGTDLRAVRMPAVQLNYTVRFLCPAFLGNAEQSGQWRTPPFKALLRQWWRVAYAAGNGFPANANAMRSAEGALFGAAADVGNSNQSRVRLRLDKWDTGRLMQWESAGSVWHPEVELRRQGTVMGEGREVGSDLYLGFGPLTLKDNRTALKAKAAIKADETATLRLALTPEVGAEDAAHIARALALIDLYGTLGGRSRNGWGSLALQPRDGSPALARIDGATQREWRAALGLDWAHAIGRDDKGALIWVTEPFGDWKAAMRRLAEVKIKLRTQFKLEPRPNERHWLSYPITHHLVGQWERSKLRLPNSLRFKLRRDDRDRSKLHGIVFHVPCRPPRDLSPDPSAVAAVWEGVHRFLDDPDQKLNRIPF